jgi:hypothetical protein
MCFSLLLSWHSLVDVATGYGLDGRGIEVRFPTEAKDFLFVGSRPALGTMQPPIQLAPGAISAGLKRPRHEDDRSPPCGAEVNNA